MTASISKLTPRKPLYMTTMDRHDRYEMGSSMVISGMAVLAIMTLMWVLVLLGLAQVETSPDGIPCMFMVVGALIAQGLHMKASANRP